MTDDWLFVETSQTVCESAAMYSTVVEMYSEGACGYCEGACVSFPTSVEFRRVISPHTSHSPLLTGGSTIYSVTYFWSFKETFFD